MYPYSLLPGDRLLVKKPAVIDDAITHSGTYMGSGLVAHNSPKKGLVKEAFEAFADGREVQVIENGGISERLLHERFEQCKSDPNYRLFGNNCEHLCSFLETGKAVSPQLQGGVTGFTGGVFATRALKIENTWASLLVIGLSTYFGARLGAPKPDQGQLTGAKLSTKVPRYGADAPAPQR